jgi:hypothetical protein
MSRLLSKLFQGSATGTSNGSPPTHHFILHLSSQDSDIIDVHTAEQPPKSPPVYTFTNNKKKITLYRGEPYPHNVIGGCTSANMGLSMNLSLHGRQFSIRNSITGTKFVLEPPDYGRLECKPTSLLGSGLSLYGNGGEKLATIMSNGLMNPKQKQVLIYVPCGGYYAEMILLTAIAARWLDKRADDIVLKALSNT